ncbi:MAG: hypothetical protein AUJ18_10950 [Candidatus Hydrogenedentes bacterium CG1_02_42_14]|nr:MAG: hypothetical protein AUJ18_10950 [Candidatus Hydrogenedentes bacterium CG1_02_42_14]
MTEKRRKEAHDADDKELELIIHGHFYQPPREDPWTEEIEEESSAEPFSNWNERIHSECYRPNSVSRVLGEFGKIREIVNNYTYLSFNFGPTLLSWMEKYDPQTLARIVKADSLSMARNNGHGNAIAQVYNHIIMPLADEKDRETEILWGIADFRKHFGREPEAMWMSETAVDIATLEAVIKHGMKFVILSPFQAAQVQTPDKKWVDVSNGKIDTSQPYWIQTPSGNIAAFFYEPELSSDISFNHLLHSSEIFVERLMEAFEKNSMVNIATDGEIYGHHEPFGDMCLAYTFSEYLSGKENKISKRIRVTNYASFLERHPPKLEAKLKAGGTSWSCAHGVERWRSDCGCRINHDNGWNQKWRTPLREALDTLRDSLRKVFESEGAKCFKDPWAVRNAYIDVILSDYNPEEKRKFAGEWFISKEAEKCWRLLASQRNALLMYTSCGWFFDDISGIEPKQLMLYASKAHTALGQLISNSSIEKFSKKLHEAVSNIPSEGNGSKIFHAITTPRLKAKQRFLNQTILSNFSGIEAHKEGRYKIRLEGEAFWGENDEESNLKKANGISHLGRGTALALDVRTESKTRFAWISKFQPSPPETIIFEIGENFRWPGGDPRGKTWDEIRPVAGKRKGALVLGMKDLFRVEARHILNETENRTEKEFSVLLKNVVGLLKPVFDISDIVGLKVNESIIKLLKTISEYVWHEYVIAELFHDAKIFEHKMKLYGIEISKERVREDVSNRVDRMLKRIGEEGVRSPEFDRMLTFMKAAQDAEIRIDAKVGQEIIYSLLRSEGRSMIGAMLEEKSENYPSLLKLFDAAARLNIDISYEQKLIEPFEKKLSEDPSVWP